LQAAVPKVQVQQHFNVAITLADQVQPGDAAIDNAVLHVFGNVVGADEKDVDGSIAATRRQRAHTRFDGSQTGGFEQCPSGLAQPSL
jgi:hypothetical protein